MTSNEIRKQFLDFFDERNHRVVASSPLVLPNDPTLLFANAGMNQFKDTFTGREPRDYLRAATSQKCLRVSGKHNDLEMVGRTPRHHTFFEMLGNFSFGDYFKREAIEYAWELITKVYGLPEERLWVTVFEGDEAFPADDEAATLWEEVAGVDPGRILRLPAAENFWRMGDTGPCGPCSEIHFDLGEDLTSVEGESTPANDDRRYLEIWNLVFMQFDQAPDGVSELPAPSIDTGMGLERITSVLQGKRTNYDTDIFVPLLDAAAERAGVRRGQDPEQDFSLRVIADHARAFAFLVADGVVPSNDKRGYVMRRLLRRAIRHGRKLGIGEPFLHDVTPVVIESLSPVYPELAASQDAMFDIGRREEQRFAATLATGLQMLDEAIDKLPTRPESKPLLPGKDLFLLYDTFGFPLDLARDIADEKDIALDEAGFEAEMQKQRERAQASWKQESRAEVAEAYGELARRHAVEFVGYEQTRLDQTAVLALISEGKPVERLASGQRGELVLATTPFYAESGGQVGDTGWLAGPQGRGTVVDTKRPAPGLIVHQVQLDEGVLAVGDRLAAEVDESRRLAVQRNHTATHLVHAALREVVGTHVKQAGSYVGPERLRFDFSHFAPLSDETMADVEALVHRMVLADLSIQTELLPIDEALRRGAMALFGEKYGETVRMVSIGEFSLELCGGIHTQRSGQLGLVKLTAERGVASGTRRVEAVSGDASLELFRQDYGFVRSMEDRLAVPRDQLAAELSRRLDQIKELQRELEKQRLGAARGSLMDRAGDAAVSAGVRFVAERVEGVTSAELRQLADNLRQKLGSGVVVLGRAEGEKAGLLVAVTPDLKDRLPAGSLVRDLAKIIGGGGGGRPDLAEAGGRDPGRLDEALQAVSSEIARRMENTG